MNVEIFRRTVKDRRRGASWDLLQHMAEGIKACGDNPIIVNVAYNLLVLANSVGTLVAVT